MFSHYTNRLSQLFMAQFFGDSDRYLAAPYSGQLA